VSAAKVSSEEAAATVLASGTEMTGAEIAAATGLGRSTVGTSLTTTPSLRCANGSVA
jgi:hypothetical protein